MGETLRRIPFAIVAALACNLPFAIAQNAAGLSQSRFRAIAKSPSR